MPKKGNLTDCNTWIGLAILSVPGKFMAKISLEHFCETLDRKLREGKARFRAGKACADHILVLRNLIEQ